MNLFVICTFGFLWWLNNTTYKTYIKPLADHFPELENLGEKIPPPLLLLIHYFFLLFLIFHIVKINEYGKTCRKVNIFSKTREKNAEKAQQKILQCSYLLRMIDSVYSLSNEFIDVWRRMKIYQTIITSYRKIKRYNIYGICEV